LLASLEERSIHEELDCFLEVEDESLKADDLVDEATRDVFALFWEATELPAVEALPCFQKYDSRVFFSVCLVMFYQML